MNACYAEQSEYSLFAEDGKNLYVLTATNHGAADGQSDCDKWSVCLYYEAKNTNTTNKKKTQIQPIIWNFNLENKHILREIFVHIFSALFIVLISVDFHRWSSGPRVPVGECMYQHHSGFPL